MHLLRPAALAAVIVALVLPTSLLAGCGRAECSASLSAPIAYPSSFLGIVTAKEGETVDFTVEAVQTAPGHAPDAHVPSVGATVSVVYSGDTAAFVHSGRRYRVIVDWEDGSFRSWVHEAQDCDAASGTTHVDGSAIDTADFPWLHSAVVALALVPVVGLAVLAAVVGNQRRRARRRRTVPDDTDVES